MLTPRERWKAAVSHQPTSRPLLDLGSSLNTSISKLAYEKLLQFLKIKPQEETRVVNTSFQVVEVAEPVLERLHIDTRPLFPNPSLAPSPHCNPDGSYIDEWRIRYQPAYSNGKLLYYDAVTHPLSRGTVQELREAHWPNPHDRGRFEGLREKARRLRETTDYVIVGHAGDTSLFENARDLRGMANFLMDCIRNKEWVHTLMSKVCEIQCARVETYLSEVGEYLDVICVADDLSGQDRPLMSPSMYREMIKPYHKKYLEVIKNNTDAFLHFHSCGTVQYFLEDLIALEVDIINPVQVSAKGMDPKKLKTEFGDRIIFWGGIDTQEILPHGTAEDTRREVRKMIRILGESGGYVLSAVHNIQAGVPPENIVAMFDEAYGLGK